MIEAEGLGFAYPGGKNILDSVSFSIPDGTALTVTGPSGSGKTTLLRLLAGLEKPQKGTIAGTEGRRISMVFQENRLLPWKNTLQNAALFSDGETARTMLERLGLGDAADKMPAELSGGMSRRAELARALCHPFDILILDEAFTGLDDAVKEVCLEAVREAAEGKILILAAHDLKEADRFDSQILTL